MVNAVAGGLAVAISTRFSVTGRDWIAFMRSNRSPGRQTNPFEIGPVNAGTTGAFRSTARSRGDETNGADARMRKAPIVRNESNHAAQVVGSTGHHRDDASCHNLNH